jgi:hypothetical protein
MLFEFPLDIGKVINTVDACRSPFLTLGATWPFTVALQHQQWVRHECTVQRVEKQGVTYTGFFKAAVLTGVRPVCTPPLSNPRILILTPRTT